MMVVVEVEVDVEGGRMMQSGSLVLAHWFGGDSGRHCLVQLSIPSQIRYTYYQKPTYYYFLLYLESTTQSIDITLWNFN